MISKIIELQFRKKKQVKNFIKHQFFILQFVILVDCLSLRSFHLMPQWVVKSPKVKENLKYTTKL